MKKIKISKKVLLIIGIVIFAIILGSLIRTYSQQAREQGQLSASLAAQQALATKFTADRVDWENKLAQAQSLLDTSQKKFPQSVECIEYGEDLFDIADDCNLELTSLTMSNPSSTKVGAVTYSVATFVVKVNGDVYNILDFIYAIRTGDDFELPWSAEVDGVNIGVGSQGVEASITLDIYAYQR
jgi:type II secretory pathway pseudopilin PulG